MNVVQKYILNQIESGREFKQFNYKNTSKIQFIDNKETINIKTIQALRKLGHTIVWEIKQK